MQGRDSFRRAMDLLEFSSYAEFGADDQRRLIVLWPHVEPHLDDICRDFYDRVLAHPTTSQVIRDDATVARLMITLKRWLQELLNGPWDDAYVLRRQRIGRVHVEVGVDHASMFMAMSAMQARVSDIAIEALDEPQPALAAIRKVTNLDLGLMTSAYHSLQQERRLRDVQAVLVAHLPAIALLVDASGHIQSATPAAEWLCRRPIDVGQHYTDVLATELVQAAELERYIERALATGNDIRLPRVDARHAGQARNLSLTLVPFEIPERGVLLYIEDHTHAVDAERRMQQQEHLAQVGTMSATIAHELRNPLAGISGALQVIAAGLPESDRRAPVLGKVLDQVRALNRMVTDLLAYSRPDASRVETGIDLIALVHDVAEDLRADHPAVRVQIEGEGIVSVDPNMVRQVLLNLCINAAQAMGGNGLIHVYVDAHAIRVCDAGPGIPEHARARAFEPFFTTKLKGTGLGLPISQKIARAMGGDLILLDGGPLGGACFEFQLGR